MEHHTYAIGRRAGKFMPDYAAFGRSFSSARRFTSC